MAPLLEDEDDRNRDDDMDIEHAGVKPPQTGEELFDDSGTAEEED